MNKDYESHNDAGMEARLWAYLDGQSEETPEIENLLQDNKEWKQKYGELLELQTLLKEAELELPSLRFTKNVMEGLAKYQIAPAAKAYINKNIVWGITAFFITVIFGFVVYAISQINWSGNDAQRSGIGDYLNGVDYLKMFNSNLVNGFMMLNVVLGLFLFDRFLNMKRKRLNKG